MGNNKKYLEKVSIVFLIALASAFIRIFFVDGHIFQGTIGIRNNFYFFLSELLFTAPFFLALGIVLNKWRQVAAAIIVSLIIIAFETYGFNSYKVGTSDTKWIIIFIIVQLLNMLPYMAFFLMEKNTAVKMFKITVVIFLCRGIGGALSFSDSLLGLDKLFHLPNNFFYESCTVLVFVGTFIFKTVVFSELQNYADDKKNGWKTRIINPFNSYNKVNATIIFWALKFFVIAVILGQLHELARTNVVWSRSDTISMLMLYNTILNSFLTIFSVIFGTWYLRKFLLEFFISYNINSRLVYWLLMIPGIGFIIWLIILINKKSCSFAEKEMNVEKFAGESPNGVSIFVCISIGIEMILVVMNGVTILSFLFVFLNCGLVVWVIFKRSGYYICLYTALFLFLLTMIFIVIYPATTFDGNLNFVYLFLLYNVGKLILIYPVYYFEDFNYNNEEKNRIVDEENLLAEFE